MAPFKLKKVKSNPIPPWRNNNEIMGLKRNCRVAERRWRKYKITVNYQIFQKQTKIYDNVIKKAWRNHFSKLICENHNNPKFLFSTTDRLINPVFNRPLHLNTDSACEEFAAYFSSKAELIRMSLTKTKNESFKIPKILTPNEETLERFLLVDAEMLDSQLRPATCLLDPIPTSFLNKFIHLLNPIFLIFLIILFRWVFFRMLLKQQ